MCSIQRIYHKSQLLLLIVELFHLALKDETVRLSNVDRVDLDARRLLIGRHVNLKAQQLGRNSKCEWQGGGAKLRSTLIFCMRKPRLGCKQPGRNASRHRRGRRGHWRRCLGGDDADHWREGIADRRDIRSGNDWSKWPNDGRIKDGVQRLVGQHDAAIVGARLSRGLVGDRVALAQKIDGFARQLESMAAIGGRGRRLLKRAVKRRGKLVQVRIDCLKSVDERHAHCSELGA